MRYTENTKDKWENKDKYGQASEGCRECHLQLSLAFI